MCNHKYVGASEDERPKRYKCDFEGCTKRYSRPCLVFQHKRSHYDERSFLCSYPGCGKGFLRNSHLKVHMLTHSKEKPHVCPHCGKGFNTGQQISRHLKAHRNNSTRTYENTEGVKKTATKTQATEFEKLMRSPTDPLFGMAQMVYSNFSAPEPATASNLSETTSGAYQMSPNAVSLVLLVSISPGEYGFSNGNVISTDPGLVDPLGASAAQVDQNTLLGGFEPTSTDIGAFDPAQTLGTGTIENNFGLDTLGPSLGTNAGETFLEDTVGQNLQPGIPSNAFAAQTGQEPSTNTSILGTDSFSEDGQSWWCKDDACCGLIGYGSLGELITHYDVSHHYVPEDLHILYDDIVSRPPEDEFEPGSNPLYFFRPCVGCPFNVHVMNL